ncbi:MAG: hypothetical protein AAFP70_09055 [Calditrichota bacterium]
MDIPNFPTFDSRLKMAVFSQPTADYRFLSSARCLLPFAHFFLVLLFFAVPAFGQGTATHHPPFLIIDYAENPKAVELVDRILAEQLSRIGQYFEGSLPDSNRVVIASGPQQFYQFEDLKIPKWAAAVYLTGRRLILVKSPGWKGSIRSLEQDLRHEMVHLLVDYHLGSRSVPLWYNEGLAEVLSGESIDLADAARIAADLRSREVMFLEDLDSLQNFTVPQVQMAYIYAYSAMDFLLERMEGRMTLNEFHQQIKRFGWEKALQNASGYDSREFEIYWYTQLRDNYRWYLLLNFDNFLWIAIIGIFFLVFWLKRNRMKQLFRSWREEEINNNLW